MLCIILLLLVGRVFAQPVVGPFEFYTADTTIHDVEVCVRGDTADIVWIKNRVVLWNQFYLSSHNLADRLMTCAALREWPQRELHSLIARTNADWSCILFQDERADYNTPNSAAHLASVVSDGSEHHVTPLDSGHTTAHFPPEGDGGRGGFRLTADESGMLYASWLSEYFVIYDASVYTHAAWLGVGDSVHESQIGYSGNFWFDRRNQSPISIEPDTRIRTVTGEFEYGLTTCIFDSLDNWDGGCTGNDQPLDAGICYDFGFLDQNHGLAIWAVDDYDSIPQIASVAFNDTTVYNAINLGELGLESISSTAFHPNYGFAAIQALPGYLLLARIDTNGQAVQPVGVLYATEGTSFIVDADVTISDSGDVIAVWSEYSNWDEGPRTLKIAWTDWTTYLDTPDGQVPTVPRDLSLSAFPNPFNNLVMIRFDLPQAGGVELAVFDVRGRRVETLMNEFAAAGMHELRWAPASLASGVYFARLDAPFGRVTAKLLYLK